MSKNLIVAIDGPAGSGKSTSAKLVAQKLGYLYIDTGAMYRAITFLAIKNNLKITDSDAITELTDKTDIQLNFIDNNSLVKVNNVDITDEIRSQKVNLRVSEVSAIEGIRKVLVKKQREIGEKAAKGVVMEGRDIGSVVFPDADVKIFLTATIEQRAKRRAKEYEEKGIVIPVEEIKKNLEQRDNIDSTREASPLIKAPGAMEIDTSKVTIEEQVDLILNEVKKTAEFKGIEITI